jgi:hypothetical protein
LVFRYPAALLVFLGAALPQPPGRSFGFDFRDT